jgi:hypothetical protein
MTARSQNRFGAPFCSVSEAHAEGCTPNHELYRIVPEYRAVLLDGGDIKRVMFVDWKDERLNTWKPGHNITFCPDDNKMINTTINSVATLLSEFVATCKTLLMRWIATYRPQWDYTNKDSDPKTFVTEAKSQLGFYYEVCTDHKGGWFEKHDFQGFSRRKRMSTPGLYVDFRNSEQFHELIVREHQKYGTIIREAGIQPE